MLFRSFVDEDLHNVAGHIHDVLWHRKDLNQHHGHWSRTGGERPKFLDRAQAKWDEGKRLFVERQAAGFPGSKLL